MSYSKTEFERLQAYWYQVAKDSGFEDAEKPSGGLKKALERRFIKVQDHKAVNKYYRLASEILYTHTFSTTQEQQIWDYHSRGWSLRKIAAELKLPLKTVDLAVIKIGKLYGLR